MSKRAIAAAALALLAPFASGASASAQAPGARAPSADAARVGAVRAEKAKTPKPSTPTLPKAAVTLDGAGANSIDPFFEAAFYAYHQAHSNITVNYDPAGSSVGVTDIQQQTVDFGDSEIPMATKDLAKAKGTVLQVPVDLGGVAISYNIPGALGGLKLDGTILENIFDGTIRNWDDPAIAEETGDTKLPDLAIVPVHRADTSGPSWDLDDYLIKTSKAWAAVINTSKPSKAWPLPGVGVGEQLNSGVATYIAQTPGAIGYVEYGYALKAKFTNAAIENTGGNYITPTENSIAQAGRFTSNLSWSNFSIIGAPGATSYPIANFSWTLLYQKQTNTTKGEALKALFWWVVTAGQLEASSLGYAPLPADVVALSESTLNELETSTGKPLS